nr:hypothetical protein [Tanacetum cinerariifolium]
TYSSVHSEARSWSIPSEDPYEEAAQQSFEQAPHSPEAGIPKADIPPQNRPLLATPRPGYEVEESFAAAARRPGPTMAHRAYCRALEARVAVLETYTRRLEWQRQVADDFDVQHIMRTYALEAGARDDTLEDT